VNEENPGGQSPGSFFCPPECQAWGSGSAGDLEIRLAGVPDHQFCVGNVVGQRPGQGLVRVQPVGQPAVNQPAAQFGRVEP
jgi:hypothetical protein